MCCWMYTYDINNNYLYVVVYLLTYQGNKVYKILMATSYVFVSTDQGA